MSQNTQLRTYISNTKGYVTLRFKAFNPSNAYMCVTELGIREIRKYDLKYRLQIGGHFIPTSMYECTKAEFTDTYFLQESMLMLLSAIDCRMLQ